MHLRSHCNRDRLEVEESKFNKLLPNIQSLYDFEPTLMKITSDLKVEQVKHFTKIKEQKIRMKMVLKWNKESLLTTMRVLLI